jgi:hypothetical protein
LKLFNQHSAKKILFVLRDYSEKENKFELLKKEIESDLMVIWNEIQKPKEYLLTKPTDLFSFEYVILPNYIHERDKFNKECFRLRSRFNPLSRDTLFVHNKKSAHIPIDGLPCFIEQTWQLIKSHKEFSLPD